MFKVKNKDTRTKHLKGLATLTATFCFQNYNLVYKYINQVLEKDSPLKTI